MSVCIDRCVCCKTNFATAQKDARELDDPPVNLRELVEKVDVGRGCGLCHPYLQQMLMTGKTQFTEVLLS